MKARDPFEAWRDEQRQAEPLPPEAEPRIDLSPGRAARRALAIDAMYDAREIGDEEAFQRTSRELVNLNRRLFLEQTAENEATLGIVPRTLDGCIAVLAVAGRIIEMLDRNGFK